MRAQAIVYRSNTGFTKQYAEMLSQQTGLPAYDQKCLKDELAEGTPIVFMGWVRAGRTQGFKQAAKKFQVVAICPVGMGLPNPMAYDEAVKRSGMAAIFCLHGGFAFQKLRGLNRMLMRDFSRNITNALSAIPNLSETQEVMLNLARNGGSYVDQKYIDPLIQWLNGAELTEIVRPGCPDNPQTEADEEEALPEEDAAALPEEEPAEEPDSADDDETEPAEDDSAED